MLTKAVILSFVTATLASPVDLETRQSCPNIHIFGARETTAPPGYGSSSTVVNLILNAYPGSTSEAINYPASGSNPSYGVSVADGVSAVCTAVGNFRKQCPNSKIVLVGYSQGSEIFDVALCGTEDPNQGLNNACSISGDNIAAAIFMGDPKFEAGAPYNVGTCEAGGFDHGRI